MYYYQTITQIYKACQKIFYEVRKRKILDFRFNNHDVPLIDRHFRKHEVVSNDIRSMTMLLYEQIFQLDIYVCNWKISGIHAYSSSVTDAQLEHLMAGHVDVMLNPT